MEDKLTVRDRIAMSLDVSLIPQVSDHEAMVRLAKEFGIEWSDNPLKQIEFSFACQSIMRYKYADAMLRSRSMSEPDGSSIMYRCKKSVLHSDDNNGYYFEEGKNYRCVYDKFYKEGENHKNHPGGRVILLIDEEGDNHAIEGDLLNNFELTNGYW